MQPFKPFFRGEQQPPHHRLTSCQKCFRTPDIEEVGTTARHCTFFEMLGNFSFGDYFKQAGPVGPCGPCSELYYDRGPDFGGDGDRPGDDTERMLEYWNLVFMQYELHDDGSLTPLPKTGIDTGLGLDRTAAILQDVPSVYETAHIRPIVELGEELAGRRYEGADYPTQRALRILADHGRGMTFLLADGVVPSNEDRGYVLRRIMRRAIQQ